MNTSLVEVRLEGFPELERAVEDFRALIKDDAGKALGKAARLTTLSLHRMFREHPPRPLRGSIKSAAQARGYRINPLSRSYLTGMSSALKILGENKSGYFQVSSGSGSIRVTPVKIGKTGRVLKPGQNGGHGALLTNRAELSPARRRDLASYRKLLTQANRGAKTYEARKARVRGYLDTNQIPSGAVQLNVGALAAIRAISIRESAASGGYLAAQFLSYKGVRSIGRTEFRTKDRKLASTVAIAADSEGDATSAIVSGYLAGSAKIAVREGIIPRAIAEAAKIYRQDIIDTINRRKARLGGVR